MEQTMKLANSPILWILALASVSIVLWQTWIFFMMAKKYVRDTNILSKEEMNKAMKVGIISTIGPAVAIFTIAVVLIGLVGGPITLSRIGVIGSAAFESLSASAGSGNTVGTANFTETMLTTASWVMAVGGSGWLLVTFFLTKSLDMTKEKMKSANPALLAMIGSITPFMVFSVMGYDQVVKKLSAATPNYGTLAALVTGAVTMFIMNKLGQTEKGKWLLEWGMGFAIIAAMIAGSLVG